MKHCVECGTELIKKELEKEGLIPFCPKCEQFRFPIFNTAVSMIVVDRKNKKILLIQQYGRPFYILVAGYVNRGEAVETAVVREVKEETGLDVNEIRFNRSKFFEPSNTLMINFTCYIDDANALSVNEEIDSYAWFDFAEAKKEIKDGSLAEEFLVKYLDDMENVAG
ncbi:MAG: NUDIX domain-containing protein [Lachnospiraceae bacterium]|nr:NUDIX domain-containing protein [Lachnospiraceae bacterium]MDO4966707.1 NUDIX domain-containing protein [Lachnospiraceae bacterium]